MGRGGGAGQQGALGEGGAWATPAEKSGNLRFFLEAPGQATASRGPLASAAACRSPRLCSFLSSVAHLALGPSVGGQVDVWWGEGRGGFYCPTWLGLVSQEESQSFLPSFLCGMGCCTCLGSLGRPCGSWTGHSCMAAPGGSGREAGGLCAVCVEEVCGGRRRLFTGSLSRP